MVGSASLDTGKPKNLQNSAPVCTWSLIWEHSSESDLHMGTEVLVSAYGSKNSSPHLENNKSQ